MIFATVNDIAISVENLSKAYRIGLKEKRHDTLTGALVSWAKAPVTNFHRLRRLNTFGSPDDADEEDTLWALKNVSFEVKRGEVVGVIGRNGAGKSTLLKILSRITDPTSGRAVIRGRVSSLLEVGTGFHPELTGRENIYMNGTILGMTKREIDRKFDQIVDFSGVEKFIDTAVKRYSSGMKVRLAFSVAAHLEPEILIIDEVLAVGDVEFQNKCLGKMQDISRQGRTVLFVSHNMAAVRRLCERGIVLDNGGISEEAEITQAVNHFVQSLEVKSDCSLLSRKDRQGTGKTRLSNITLLSDGQTFGETLRTGSQSSFLFEITYGMPTLTVLFTIYDSHGTSLSHFSSAIISPEDNICPAKAGREFICEIEELPLLPGRYRLNVALMEGAEIHDYVEGAFHFRVNSGFIGGRPAGSRGETELIAIRHRWTESRKTC